MASRKFEQPSCLLSTSLPGPSVELYKVIASKIDGRYVIDIEGGKLVGANPIPTYGTCVVNPTIASNVASFLSQIPGNAQVEMEDDAVRELILLYERVFRGPKRRLIGGPKRTGRAARAIDFSKVDDGMYLVRFKGGKLAAAQPVLGRLGAASVSL